MSIASDAMASGPTVVLVNGTVWTGDPAGSRAEALAMAAGRIAAVGTDAEVKALTGSATRVVDLAGRMVVPGFVDAHVHPIMAGLSMAGCDLLGLRSAQDYLAVIAEAAATAAPGAWIRGGGWSFDAFPGGLPRAEDLDRVTAGHPAALYNRDTHTLWVNREALRRAGIDADTPDPTDGRIERDEDGRPSGALQEGAMRLVERVLPATTAADLRQALRTAQDYLHALGVTSWQDARVEEEHARTYADLADAHELTALVRGALWWDRDAGIEQLPALLERRRAQSRTDLHLDSVKIMLDGVCENFTAAVLDPYLGLPAHAHHDTGIRFFDTEDLVRFLVAIEDAGLQAHFHAVGDAAVRQALDVVEAVRGLHGERGLRHHIAHIQIVHPDDVPRFRRLNVAANAQPLWARNEPQMTELTIPHLGQPRAGWQYPFATLHRSGAVLAVGSDWPVSTPDPLREIHVAVNRTPVPQGSAWTPEDGTFLPDERLDLTTALRAATAGSAWVNGQEERCGTLAVGKRADLAVLDRDLFEQPATEIWSAHVEQTWAGGTCVHGDTAL